MYLSSVNCKLSCYTTDAQLIRIAMEIASFGIVEPWLRTVLNICNAGVHEERTNKCVPIFGVLY